MMQINYSVKTICLLDNPVSDKDNTSLIIASPCMFMYEYYSFYKL